MAAGSQLLLAVVEEGAELVVAEVLTDSLQEDHVVLGFPDDLAEVQGITFICRTDLDAVLFFSVLKVVHITVHEVNLVVREAVA